MLLKGGARGENLRANPGQRTIHTKTTSPYPRKPGHWQGLLIGFHYHVRDELGEVVGDECV
jgi:hypothetical protein